MSRSGRDPRMRLAARVCVEPLTPLCARIVKFVGALWSALSAARMFQSAPNFAVNAVQHWRSIVLLAVAVKHRARSFAPSAAQSSLGRAAYPASPELAPSITPRAVFAERLHLTVMFCDLVGSTALSVHLDVEDLHEVIAAYQKRAAEIVTRFGGFVARRVGDGVLVYFGYPNAEEDDPEQAVRASLALVEGIGSLGESASRFRSGVGIATGLVVVGDLIGSGIENENEVLGEGPNLAARLLSLAEPKHDRNRR